jgi:hypothetical protein
MTSYYLPDITGKNPKYYQANKPYFIYRRGMRIFFKNSPIFVDDLRLAMTDGSGTLLVRDVDWVANDTDVDEDAMQQAYLQDPQFNKILVKSVTITSDKALNTAIAATFQEFYLTVPGQMYDDGTPFEFTPQLAKAMSRGIADLRQQLARPTSPLAPNGNSPVLLPFDINCERDGNKVPGEVVSINTVSGAKVIRLAHGAFFKDSVTIKFDGVPLNPTTDYLPLVVSPLNDRTTNKSGIYQYLFIVKEITGSVAIDYHAVGGDVQLDDVNLVHEELLSIKTFLSNIVFVTPNSIPDTPAFRSLDARMNLMENDVRSLLSGAPTYGDATTGVSVKRGITATNSNFHWWTIANLYKVQGSTDVITADQFKGRVFIPGAKIAVGFTVDFNSNQARNPVSFVTDSAVFDPNYTLFGDAPAASPVLPAIRVVWNGAGGSFAGASIQIGLPLLSLNDVMVVEDLSSAESCWLLDRTGQITSGTTPAAVSPKDDAFALPDGTSIWTKGAANSKFGEFAPKFDKGYLVYTGSVIALNQLNNTTDTTAMFNTALPNYFPVSDIKTIVVTLASPDGSKIYDVEIPVTSSVTGVKFGQSTFLDLTSNLIAMRAGIERSTQTNVKLKINIVDTSADVPSTDVIRYVRVKV